MTEMQVEAELKHRNMAKLERRYQMDELERRQNLMAELDPRRQMLWAIFNKE